MIIVRYYVLRTYKSWKCKVFAGGDKEILLLKYKKGNYENKSYYIK